MLNAVNPSVLKTVIFEAHERFKGLNEGALASYIPELLRANPAHFAISVATVNGELFSVGESTQPFTLQSTSKPFVYGLALEQLGKKEILKRVGVEPSGEAFDSIIELEAKTHLPFNPMINSGAIVTTHLVQSENFTTREEKLLALMESYTSQKAGFDFEVYLSEKNTAHRNRAIAHLLRHFNVIDDQFEASLDLYFKQCSILSNAEKLSMMAATLANAGVQPFTQNRILKNESVRDVLSIMFTCGMYDTAGKWADLVGLPSKSGVSGAIFAVVPGSFGIAVYSPLIDSHGHSIRGTRVIEYLSQKLKLHIFEPKEG